MTIIEEIVKRENLLAAWLKVKNHLLEYEGWVDIEALYSFEATLDKNLKLIHDEFLEGRWLPQKMVPLPRLKIEKDDKGMKEEKIRQDFWVPIIDQVAWVAVVNIIGPIVDLQMPSWSLANRLYRSVFYEDSEIEQKKENLRVGPYRNSPGLLYRRWHTSWSLYRRLAYLTWTRMTQGSKMEETIEGFAEGDKRVYWSYVDTGKIPFIEKKYWPKLVKKVFWAKIDFKDFFPKLEREAVLQGIIYGLDNFNPTDYGEVIPEVDKVKKLLKQMLEFSWVDPNWSADEKNSAFLNEKDKGIPVGLFVSGFLANAALLPIEAQLIAKLKRQRSNKIAHFRYVDDHLFLSNDFNAMLVWINKYISLVEGIGVAINTDKSEPKELNGCLDSGVDIDIEKSKFVIDSQNPQQFTTQTLALISDIANKDFGLLHLDEQESLMQELKHLLKTPFQEDEIRNDTRVSFTIYRIIRLIIEWQRDWTSILNLQRESIVEPESENAQILPKQEEEISKAIDKDEKEYNKKIKDAFRSLVEALKNSPERLRLWRLLIEFCRQTGYEGWEEIKPLLRLRNRQYRFFKAILWLELGNAVIKSTLSSKIEPEIKLFSWEIDQQERFLNTINFWLQSCRIEPQAEKYEMISWKYLKNCIRLSEFIKGNKSPKFSFRKPELYYWAELNITSRDESKPSQLWIQSIKKLNFNNPAGLSLMMMYPKELKSIAPFRFSRINRMVKEKRTGWEWEGYDFTRRISGRINLVEWSKWVKDTQDGCNKNISYDPRIGEWTALEITKKIVNIYQGQDLRELDNIIKERLIPHPANFTLLEELTQLKNGKPYTWYSWENEIKTVGSNFIQVIDKRYRVQFDNRISPFWLPDDESNQTQRIEYLLYGIGLILLGLLRNDFSFSARWNLPAYARDWRPIGKEWFSSFACSTNTLGILEAILLPRNNESKRISARQIKYDFESDILYDTDPIYDFTQLEKRLISAQQELYKSQISSYKEKPRQLVPIDIRNLLKRSWLQYED